MQQRNILIGVFLIILLITSCTKPLAMGVKVPEFSFTNQDQKLVSNKDYLGKVYVLDFFFTTCPTICPKMTKSMVQLQNKFFGNPDFGLVSISINPVHDTPTVLKQYAKKYGCFHKNWNFLTGDKKEIYELSNLGFKLYSEQNGEVEGGFEHSGLFALVDKEGNLRSRYDSYGNARVYYDGLDPKEVTMLKNDIKLLINE